MSNPKTLQAIRGMNDFLPEQTRLWQALEKQLRHVIVAYGYQEIRMPIVESTNLFKRSIGEVTDIVEKEMYTFDDRNGDSLTLRPEGTAGCVRAVLEHGLIHNQEQRLWYYGTMYRHERPQRGRYREFYQIGVENFGIATPAVDVELILMSARFWERLGIVDKVTLQLNTLGSPESRLAYRDILIDYFSKHREQLDEDSQRRLQTNPLRILDSKNPAMHDVINGAPKLLKHLDEASKQHFQAVCHLLDATGIAYDINPHLVRGLDYYCHTVFEWVTNELGAQGTICAGGRYDGLVEQLGGRATPAAGFAMGLERIVELFAQTERAQQLRAAVDVYMIVAGETAKQHSFLLAKRLRDELPDLRLRMDLSDASIKSQFKKADKCGAMLALVLGEDEVTQGNVNVKYLREDKSQESVSLSEIVEFLR